MLIVDDLEPNRKLLITLLASRGHRIVEVDDGHEALQRIREERPDLVITDMLMPTMDGVELAQRIRADHELAGMKVNFCSATYNEQETISLSESCGVNHRLKQPIEQEELIRIVDGWHVETRSGDSAGAEKRGDYDVEHTSHRR